MSEENKEYFMGIRENIIIKRRELRKKLTPNQNYCLDEIHIQCAFEDYASKTQFDLRTLAKMVQIQINQLYVILKQLHEKGLIVREKTRYEHLEILGLNPKVFDQILINKLHIEEKKKMIQLVVDNTSTVLKSSVTNHESSTHESLPEGSRIMSSQVTNHELRNSQRTEIIEEKNPPRSLRTHKNVLDGEDLNGQVSEEWKETSNSETIKKYCSQIKGIIKENTA